MATKKTARTSKSRASTATFEGVYLFKMVLFLLLGSIWVKASNGDNIDIGIPIGLLIGILFTLHEHFQIDRKIEYAVLLVAMLFGYFAPYGLYVNF
jgi:hypothetical protein